MIKRPLLVFSDLSGEVYIVSRYKVEADNVIVAQRKYDVTEEFDRIATKRKDRQAEDRKRINRNRRSS